MNRWISLDHCKLDNAMYISSINPSESIQLFFLCRRAVLAWTHGSHNAWRLTTSVQYVMIHSEMCLPIANAVWGHTADRFPDDAAVLHAWYSASSVSADGAGILDMRPISSTVGACQLKNAAGKCAAEKGEMGGRNCSTKSVGFGKSTSCKLGGILGSGEICLTKLVKKLIVVARISGCVIHKRLWWTG